MNAQRKGSVLVGDAAHGDGGGRDVEGKVGEHHEKEHQHENGHQHAGRLALAARRRQRFGVKLRQARLARDAAAVEKRFFRVGLLGDRERVLGGAACVARREILHLVRPADGLVAVSPAGARAVAHVGQLR